MTDLTPAPGVPADLLTLAVDEAVDILTDLHRDPLRHGGAHRAAVAILEAFASIDGPPVADVLAARVARAREMYGAGHSTAIAAVLADYRESIDLNMSPAWDTLAAVASCDDGTMGAWGEVLDVADAHGLPQSAYDRLHDAFGRFQRALADEIGPERITAHLTEHRPHRLT